MKTTLRREWRVTASCAVAVVIFGGSVPLAMAQDSTSTVTFMQAPTDSHERAVYYAGAAQGAQVQKQDDAKTRFKGMGFSAAIGLSLYGDDRIGGAALADSVVRVTKRNNVVATLMLETHYFFTKEEWTKSRVGIGPYIGVVSSNDEFIEAFSIGILFGLRPSLESEKSFNLGMGFVWDPQAQTLGAGINENRPLPGNEEEIRFENKGMLGFQLVASFTFL